jgi:hypothetical protein
MIDGLVIEVNIARCLECNEVLSSTHVHDYKTCSCDNLMVDGGLDYIRRGYKKGPESIEELSIVRPHVDYDSTDPTGLLILLDAYKKWLRVYEASGASVRELNNRFISRWIPKLETVFEEYIEQGRLYDELLEEQVKEDE